MRFLMSLGGLGRLWGRLGWPWRRLEGDLGRSEALGDLLETSGAVFGLGNILQEILDVVQASRTPC